MPEHRPLLKTAYGVRSGRVPRWSQPATRDVEFEPIHGAARRATLFTLRAVCVSRRTVDVGSALRLWFHNLGGMVAKRTP